MKKRGRALALLLAAVLTVSSVPGTVMAADGVKPQDGTTKEQPFWSGTGGSTRFRIPCLVSLDDGTLVAGCDARWNTSLDGGGLDTIVSRSTDKGKTWHYTFANYLGDNGNTHNNNSTAFIDPAMATDGEKVYMIADLYPAGYALNGASHAPVAGKSHDENGNILLADARKWQNCWVNDRQNEANYTYHLEKNDKKESDSAYVIKDANGAIVEGYTVDAYFNIKGKDVDANLFEADSPFQVWPTDYLYLTTSEDAGATWSVPTIVNMRKDHEQSLLVGPGRGMVTSKGRILFTAYEFTGSDKNSVAIYSDDGGKTWERGKSVSGWSSEAVVTEADGKLYMFTRHGGYYTSDDFGETWSTQKNMGISYWLNCQLTAITYPKKIDGKTAILFATPSSSSGRAAGKIFVGLVQDDGTLDWKYNYSINGSAYYAYSCLTILPDGTIGLLYESDGTVITYEDFDIEDVAKGAAIGNIWCTDENGTVADVTMTSDMSKKLTVNGLKDGAQVKVSSDNENAVTAAYAGGKVTLTSKAVTGMEKATVTVESEGEKTTVSVIVTDEKDYEIVDLRVGDTKTYTDKTGNYSGSALEGLNKDIADVTLTGEDAQAVEKQVKAQLATSEAHFDGAEKSLDECLFTFASVEGQDNTYTMSAKDGDKTVYVNYRSAASAGTVCAEASANIKLEERSDDQTFELLDQTAGANGNRLYFHKDNESKLCFDRNTGDHANCRMELYKKAANSSAESAIPGYEKVTGLSQITSGEKYLIAAKAATGTYYVVNPSAAGEKYKHVAKVVEETIPVKQEAAVALGSNAQFNDRGEKKISKCLFTFDKQAEEGKYKISATTEDGQKVYLGPKSAASAQTPLTTTEAVITVAKTDKGFTLNQMENSANGGYLYFWKDNEGKFHFDRNSSVDPNGKCEFELYKKADNAEAAEIPGYEKLNDMSEIEANGQYLIAMKAKDNKYYLLNPATGNDKYSYVAKVTGEMYKDETIGAKTDIAITGKSEGKTSVKIGNKTYFIFVKNDVEEVTIKIGETYNVPGKILNESEVTKDGIVSLEKRENMPPYKAISEITEGTYLFGNNSHIMLNTVSTAAGSEKGLGMKAVNFNNDETAKDFMWTLTKSGEGYTMKDAASGKYINISGNNVELKDAEQVLTIRARANGGFSVSANNYYLNNWAGNNNKVAAYPSDDNGWSFYKASAGNVVTGVKEGTVTVAASEGINYKITVVKDVPEVKEYTVTATVNDEAMGTAKLSPEVDKYKEGTEVTATAKVKDESKYEFVNWTVGDEEVSKKAEYKFTVDKDMELKANFKAKDPVEETFTVKVKANDTNMGEVKLDPVKAEYAKGEKVKAIATSKEGYEFVNWTVDGKAVSAEATYEFLVEKNVELTANFKETEKPVEQFTVTVKANDDKMGTVAVDPVKENYEKGDTVIVIAEAKEGYEFVNWTSEGKVFSDSAAYEFAVDKDMELTANFKAKEEPKPPVTEDTFKLNVTVNDDKMGTVKLDPAKESYKAGDVVTATATAKDGYKFVNWTVDGKEVSDKAEYAFKVDRDVTLKANFEKVAADPKPETPKPEDPKDEDKAIQTGDNGVSPIIPLAGLALAAGAAVTVLRKKED
ncbi:InlB B-repeat-containing protein [[Ruminococcus] torques]|uniref:InlB B-repeat-containing protein n=1 Tax=[Ruminococcus] torques TaxID=33039 RepID=UPI0027BA0EF3|nr:exo-alpha-sialidase [[Ruminococcus] torques]